VLSGKVRYIGCSNYPAWRLADAIWTSATHDISRFDCDQPRYNLLFRAIEDEIVPLCQTHGVGIIAYNPLAGGMLTGRYRQRREVQEDTRFGLARAGELYRKRYWNGEVFDVVERLAAFVEGRGKKLIHVALAWVLAQPGITSAIVGASRPEQLRESLEGINLVLDEEDLQACGDAWYSLPRERDPSIAQR
jgi:aryl-alcohol dehydrogenase-like predicted oxidoreductase